MNCKNCNFEIDDSALFCPKCGTKTEREEKKTVFCTGCGKQLNENDAFCSSCGKKQGAQEQAPTYSQPVYAPTVNATAEQKPKNVSKKNSILSMAFGIASVFCGLFSWYYICPFIFIAGSIIFGTLSNSKREEYLREAGEQNGFTRAGKITTIVSIPLTIVFGIIGIVLFGFLVYAIAQGINA